MLQRWRNRARPAIPLFGEIAVTVHRFLVGGIQKNIYMNSGMSFKKVKLFCS